LDLKESAGAVWGGLAGLMDGQSQDLRQSVLIIVHHDLSLGGGLTDILRGPVGHTTDHEKPRLGDIAADPAEEFKGFAVGVPGDGACVDDAEIGLGELVGRGTPGGIQKRAQLSSLGLVDPAAEGAQEVFGPLG
jgi:hypothetical protein